MDRFVVIATVAGLFIMVNRLRMAPERSLYLLLAPGKNGKIVVRPGNAGGEAGYSATQPLRMRGSYLR